MKRIVILRCLRSNNVCTGAACMRAFNTKSGAFAMARNRWSWRLIGAATAAVTAVLSIRPALKKSWSVSSALSRMLCMLAFVLSTARRMARLLPAKLLKKFASAWRLRD